MCSATPCRRSAASLDTSIAAVKAALHRGRARLRELADEPDDRPLPVLAEPERSLLAAYVDRFNARDFDAIRDMLADEVRLELVAKTGCMAATRSAPTFTTTLSIDVGILCRLWWTGARRCSYAIPAIHRRRPAYFVLLQWAGDRLTNIRDFRYARYVTGVRHQRL